MSKEIFIGVLSVVIIASLSVFFGQRYFYQQ